MNPFVITIIDPKRPIYLIYVVTNKINGKRYIGRTEKSIAHRWHDHLRHAAMQKLGERVTRNCGLFTDALALYGCSAFDLEILEVCETEEIAFNREMYWITELNTLLPNGYNTTFGKGRSWSHDERERQRRFMKGNTFQKNQTRGKGGQFQ